MSQHKNKKREVGWDVLQAGTGASHPALRPTAKGVGFEKRSESIGFEKGVRGIGFEKE